MCLLFNNTQPHVATKLKDRMVPGIPASERVPTINYALKSEVAIKLHLYLCSTHCSVLQMKNNIRNFSAMNPENNYTLKSEVAIMLWFKTVLCLLHSIVNNKTVNTDRKHDSAWGSHIALLQIDTLHCQ